MLPAGARPEKHDAPNAMAPSRIPYSFHDSWLYACINHATTVHDDKEVKAAVVEPAQAEPGKQRIGGKGCRTQQAIVQNRQLHHDFLTKLPILRAWRRASGRCARRTHTAHAPCERTPKVSDGKRCGWLGRARFIMGCASIYPKGATPLCKGGSLCSVSESSIWARTPFG